MTKALSAAGKLLDGDETIEHTTHPSRFKKKLLKKYTLAVFLFLLFAAPLVFSGRLPVPSNLRPVFIPLMVLPGAIFAYAEMERYAIMYHFTNKKFIWEQGILKKEVSSVAYDNVTKVRINQDFVDRLIDIGNLSIEVKGTEQEEIHVDGVRNPEAFRIHLQGSHDFDIDDEQLEEVAEVRDDISIDRNGEHSGEDSGDSDSNMHHRVLDQEYLEAELGRLQRKKNELEEQYQKGAFGEREYERRWYMLQGEERLLQRELDRLEE